MFVLEHVSFFWGKRGQVFHFAQGSGKVRGRCGCGLWRLSLEFFCFGFENISQMVGWRSRIAYMSHVRERWQFGFKSRTPKHYDRKINKNRSLYARMLFSALRVGSIARHHRHTAHQQKDTGQNLWKLYSFNTGPYGLLVSCIFTTEVQKINSFKSSSSHFVFLITQNNKVLVCVHYLTHKYTLDQNIPYWPWIHRKGKWRTIV